MNFSWNIVSYCARILLSRTSRAINVIIFISFIPCFTFCARSTDHNNFILTLQRVYKSFKVSRRNVRENSFVNLYKRLLYNIYSNNMIYIITFRNIGFFFCLVGNMKFNIDPKCWPIYVIWTHPANLLCWCYIIASLSFYIHYLSDGPPIIMMIPFP